MPPRLLALGLCALFLALPASGRGAPAIGEESLPGAGEARDEEEGARISEIRIEGARRAEPAAIRAVMATRVGSALDRRVLREDIRRIFGLGFFSDVRIDAEPTPQGVVVTVTVVERPAIREVRIEGNDEISTDDLREKLDVKPFQILDRAAVKRNAAKLNEQYVEKGFFLASVGYRVVEAPDNQVDVVFEVNENSKVMVKEISFMGNEKISNDQLKEVMITKEGDFLSFLTGSGTYREELFQRDMQVAQGVYYDHGYINVKFGKPAVSITPDKRSIYITIPIEEGEQYSIGAIDFAGDILTSKEDLASRMTVHGGEIFSRSKLQADIQALTNLYQDDAYAYVNVMPLTAVNAEERTVDLTFEIDQGKKVRWERIEIVGNEKTRDKVIRRELRIYEGEYFSGTALNRSKARVTALGFFEPDPRTGTVEISTRKGSSDELIVGVVEVKEKATGTFQVGAGFSSVENFIATAQISQSNFFGWGQSASLSAQISSLRQLYQIQFIEPYFLDSNWTFAFDLYRTDVDYGGFVRKAMGGDVTFGHPLPLVENDDLRLFLTYTLEDVSVTTGGSQVGGVRLFGRFKDGLTSSARLTLTWDARNNRLFPSKGFYQSASVEEAPSWLGSDFRYTRYTGVSRWYFELPWRFVFKTQGTVGYIRGPNVPVSELYFVGGINSVRGYPLRTVSPTIPVATNGNDPQSATFPYLIGGNKQLVFNNELEFPIFEKVGIRGVLFYDLGNAFAQNANFFNDKQFDLFLGMFHSVGFGFRWFSPIGPLRFEWGIPLTPRPEDQRILFEFTIGNSF
ncbi:outer membrane protein assembly factor BamA [Vulgatibacter incomptus]|uniref:Outer membrane protein assembly factor BamA n=1 Tax=Vulgatibacter incomptus TaxID=1391653 RepID=A0A0K1PEG8_9BACT|nr:outer membrane protein assembly factor BamA [Vulgatibacter incomptus]AKU91519.1 Outer membrane protein assembly factor YaeT precursor [Vulgatibacter incomptus]